MEAVNGVSEGGPPPPSPLTGCYLLIVIGEPHSQDHKDIILRRVAKGLLSWDASNCLVDLEKELAIITEQAPDGEEARYATPKNANADSAAGERLIQYASENLVTEILIHPAVSTLSQCVRNLLSSFTRHRHIIHSGYTFAANGSWALQDGTFSLADFSEAFQEIEVQRVIRAYESSISVDIHCSPEGDWMRLPKESFAKNCKIRLNPVDVLPLSSPPILNFLNYIAPFLIPLDIEMALESSEVVGNIRFSHPTLYVFPGGQGDAALFGINGFNMLLDGGFSRKACFWDFVRHLDRLDAVLLTRLNNSNVCGISSVLRRKRQNAVYPQIGHFFCNIQERKALLSPDGDKDKDPLLINLLEEGHEIVTNLKQLNLAPQSCYRDSEPINLYHKVGHGTLDMYVLSPARESKEVREFLQKWNTNDSKLFANAKTGKEFSFPLPNLVSICALLVWHPSNPDDNITRILFPGSTPQGKIFEGLDKLRQLDCIKVPVCTEKSLSPTTIKKTKDSVLDKIISSDKPQKIIPDSKKEKSPRISDNKQKSDNKTIDSNLKNGTENGDAEMKTIKKSDSVESDKSATKPQPDDKPTPPKSDDKAKPKGDSKPKETKPAGRKIDVNKSDRKPKHLIEKKSSPTTPKKTLESKINGDARDSMIKPKTKFSPSSTPAKSTKEANNRKVFESKNKSPPKREAPKPPEKKESKTERKPISRRPKPPASARPAASSPVKKVQKPDSIAKKAKLEKEGTTDSSTVSTPSADQENKKDISKLTPEELEQLKAQELADLKEEQEIVQEIEAVFRKGEDGGTGESELRQIKNISIEEKTDEEYLIVEKDIAETENAEKEIKEDETQKHTRDSEESEKQRKLSGEIKVEEQKTEDDVKPEEKAEDTIKEVPVTSLEEKVDSDKKLEEGNEQVNALESQPDEKFSATVESGATTAPTLPEDERIPLDEIKEDLIDQAIEEKYVKEETKEKEIPVIQLPTKTFEPISKLPPVVGIRLDKQAHIRDIVKTPDEVADLPVHEVADHYVEYQQDEVKSPKDQKEKKVSEKTDTDSKHSPNSKPDIPLTETQVSGTTKDSSSDLPELQKEIIKSVDQSKEEIKAIVDEIIEESKESAKILSEIPKGADEVQEDDHQEKEEKEDVADIGEASKEKKEEVDKDAADKSSEKDIDEGIEEIGEKEKDDSEEIAKESAKDEEQQLDEVVDKPKDSDKPSSRIKEALKPNERKQSIPQEDKQVKEPRDDGSEIDEEDLKDSDEGIEDITEKDKDVDEIEIVKKIEEFVQSEKTEVISKTETESHEVTSNTTIVTEEVSEIKETQKVVGSEEQEVKEIIQTSISANKTEVGISVPTENIVKKEIEKVEKTVIDSKEVVDETSVTITRDSKETDDKVEDVDDAIEVIDEKIMDKQELTQEEDSKQDTKESDLEAQDTIKEIPESPVKKDKSDDKIEEQADNVEETVSKDLQEPVYNTAEKEDKFDKMKEAHEIVSKSPTKAIIDVLGDKPEPPFKSPVEKEPSALVSKSPVEEPEQETISKYFEPNRKSTVEDLIDDAMEVVEELAITQEAVKDSKTTGEIESDEKISEEKPSEVFPDAQNNIEECMLPAMESNDDEKCVSVGDVKVESELKEEIASLESNEVTIAKQVIIDDIKDTLDEELKEESDAKDANDDTKLSDKAPSDISIEQELKDSDLEHKYTDDIREKEDGEIGLQDQEVIKSDLEDEKVKRKDDTKPVDKQVEDTKPEDNKVEEPKPDDNKAKDTKADESKHVQEHHVTPEHDTTETDAMQDEEQLPEIEYDSGKPKDIISSISASPRGSIESIKSDNLKDLKSGKAMDEPVTQENGILDDIEEIKPEPLLDDIKSVIGKDGSPKDSKPFKEDPIKVDVKSNFDDVKPLIDSTKDDLKQLTDSIVSDIREDAMEMKSKSETIVESKGTEESEKVEKSITSAIEKIDEVMEKTNLVAESASKTSGQEIDILKQSEDAQIDSKTASDLIPKQLDDKKDQIEETLSDQILTAEDLLESTVTKSDDLLKDVSKVAETVEKDILEQERKLSKDISAVTDTIEDKIKSESDILEDKLGAVVADIDDKIKSIDAKITTAAMAIEQTVIKIDDIKESVKLEIGDVKSVLEDKKESLSEEIVKEGTPASVKIEESLSESGFAKIEEAASKVDIVKESAAKKFEDLKKEMETAEDLTKEIQASADTIYDKTKELGQNIGDKTIEAMEVIEDKLNEIEVTFVEKSKEVADKSKGIEGKSKEVIETIEDMSKEVVECIEETAMEVIADKLKEIEVTFLEKSKEVADKSKGIEGKSKAVIETIEDKSKEVVECIEETAKDVAKIEAKTEEFGVKSNEIITKVEDKPKKVAEQIEDTAENIVDKMEDKTKEVEEKSIEVIEKIEDKSKEVMEHIEGTAQEVVDKIEDKTKEDIDNVKDHVMNLFELPKTDTPKEEKTELKYSEKEDDIVDIKIQSVDSPQMPEVEDRGSSPETLPTFAILKDSEFIDKTDLGRKSPKEREQDVALIVASVAEVLKSEAPLEEFKGKIPLEITSFTTYSPYTTELRETHITTLDSPTADIGGAITPIQEDKILEEQEAAHYEAQQQEKQDDAGKAKESSKISDLIKNSNELLEATSKMISDIKSARRESADADDKNDTDSGTVHRMLVTASSEDGGEETVICPPGSIIFSRSSESSGRSSPDGLNKGAVRKDTSELTNGKADDSKIAADIQDSEKKSICSEKSDDENDEGDMKPLADKSEKELVDNKEISEQASSVDVNASCSRGDDTLDVVDSAKTNGVLSGKESPEKMDVSEKMLSEDIPEKKNKLEDDKDIPIDKPVTPELKTESNKDQVALEKEISEKLDAKDDESDHTDVVEKHETEELACKKIPETTKIDNDVSSGKSSPDIKSVDKKEDGKGLSGTSTPDLKDDRFSGKSTPDFHGKLHLEKDVISGTSTPDVHYNVEKDLSDKSTPDSLAKLEKDGSGKSTPDILDTLEKSTHDFHDKLEKDMSGKSTPDIIGTLEKDVSGKSTPDIHGKLEKEASGKSTPDVIGKLQKDESGISTPDMPDKIDVKLQKDASGKSSPDLHAKLAKDISGKSTPDIPRSGKESPDLPIKLDKDSTDKSSPVVLGTVVDKVPSGKSTPDIHQDVVKLEESDKSTPESKQDVHLSGKSTPDIPIQTASGKSTPDGSKIVSEKIPELTDTLDMQTVKSGKSTPDPLLVISETKLSADIHIKQDSSKSASNEESPIHGVSEIIVDKKIVDDICDTVSKDSKLESSKESKEVVIEKSESTLTEKRDDSKDKLSGKSSPDFSDSVKVVTTALSTSVSDTTSSSQCITEVEYSESKLESAQVCKELMKETITSSFLHGEGAKMNGDVLHDDCDDGLDSKAESEHKYSSDSIKPAELDVRSSGVSTPEAKSGKSSPDIKDSRKSSVMSMVSDVKDDYDSRKFSITSENTKTSSVPSGKSTPEIKEDEKAESRKTSSVVEADLKKSVADFIHAERFVPPESETKVESSVSIITSDQGIAGPSTNVAPSKKIDDSSLSGKSTPDIAEVEILKEMQEILTHEKHIPGSSTPPTVPVSPIVKDVEQKSLKESELGTIESQRDKSPVSPESDDDIPSSPMSVTSQVGQMSYEFDPVRKLPSLDPMNTSFYGELPSEDPEVEFKKAIEEHKEARGESLVKPSSSEAITIEHAKNEQDLMTSSFIGVELPSSSDKGDKKDPIESWGKPLGLPSPAPPNDNKGTPKKDKKIPMNVSAKNKLNDDRKRSESPKKQKKINPVYVDLTYVPHHGNSYYTYVDFFKRVRARYYVFSGIEPSKEVYNALLEAKQTWEDKDLEVTIIPTYDTDVLGYWVAENEELLTKYKIDLSPSASRCTINLQDHETSCSAYRLEF